IHTLEGLVLAVPLGPAEPAVRVEVEIRELVGQRDHGTARPAAPHELGARQPVVAVAVECAEVAPMPAVLRHRHLPLPVVVTLGETLVTDVRLWRREAGEEERRKCQPARGDPSHAAPPSARSIGPPGVRKATPVPIPGSRMAVPWTPSPSARSTTTRS